MEIPIEERFAIVVPALMEQIGKIAKAVDKKFGAEGRSLLRQVQVEIGSETGEIMKPLSPGEDLRSAGTFYAQGVQMYGVEIEVEEKKDEVVIKVPKCPYGLEGTSRELCEALMAFDMGFFEAVAPNVTREIVETVAVGEPQCVLSIKPKK